jgi:hypothetical protein
MDVHASTFEVILVSSESPFRKVYAGKTNVREVAEADIEEMLGRHSSDNPRVGVEHSAIDWPVRPAQIDRRDAKIGDGLGNFLILNACDDAVAFPGAKKFGHIFRQAALNVQHAPTTVRTHVGSHA